MKPFLTLLLESFRGLKSQLIFWITLGLTVLFALIFLSLGFDEKGASVFFGATRFGDDELVKDSIGARLMYTMVFDYVVAGIWLSWIAIILALISCAPIFPNTMTEGGAAMVMTKGVSRFQVFLAKLTGSLFFAAIQVIVFVVIVMIAFKWRLGSWSFSLLWYIPAVLLVFTGLYSFLVLVAVKTRSVLTAILLTMLLWAISAGLGSAEKFFSMQLAISDMTSQTESVRLDEVDPPTTAEEMAERESYNGEWKKSREDSRTEAEKWHRIVSMIHMPLPKNGPVMASASEKLLAEQAGDVLEKSGLEIPESSKDEVEEVRREMKNLFNRNSSFYSIWSSLIFALVMFALAAWLFCRRDY